MIPKTIAITFIILSQLFRLNHLRIVNAGESGTSSCSLDLMRLYAMDACEHLQQDDDSSSNIFDDDNGTNGRLRRFISHKFHRRIYKYHLNDDNDNNNYHFVIRKSYPNGGYLKLSTNFYHKLRNLEITPKYKTLQFRHSKFKESNYRYKRDHNINNNYANDKYIIYCCYNKCDTDFFCY